MMHVLSLTSIALACLISFSAIASEVHGVFRVVKGMVKVKSAQTGQETRARIGSKVLPGDIIITDKDSRAKVVMVDNNEINVSPESQIKIEKYQYDPSAGKKDVLLNVIYGKVRSKVEQKYDGKTSKYQVKTPSAVAGVRGTDFLAGYSPTTSTSQIITFEGRVEFGALGPNGQILNPVLVTPGQMAEISRGGQVQPPTEVPKDTFENINSESNAETASSAPAPSTPTASQDSGVKEEAPKAEAAVTDTKPEAVPKTEDRTPASSSSSSMVQAGDLPSAPNSQADLPKPVGPAIPSAVRNPASTQPCDICQRVIEGGNTKLNITITH